MTNINLINHLSTLVDKVKDNQGSVETLVEKKLGAKRMITFQNLVEHNKVTVQEAKDNFIETLQASTQVMKKSSNPRTLSTDLK